MSDIQAIRERLIATILGGSGTAPGAQRRAAFDGAALPGALRTLVDKVSRRPRTVRDEDIAAARASGLSEDQVFELVVCAAVGQATRQYASARAALDAATRKE
jgi:alkylhydroperoxidase family enzyme